MVICAHSAPAGTSDARLAAGLTAAAPMADTRSSSRDRALQVFLQHGASAFLRPEEVVEARLVSTTWAAQLTAHVKTLHLPYDLWAQAPPSVPGSSQKQAAPARGVRSMLLRLLARAAPAAGASARAKRPESLEQLLHTFSQLSSLVLECGGPANGQAAPREVGAAIDHTPPITSALAACCRRLDAITVDSPSTSSAWSAIGSITSVGVPIRQLQLHNAALPPPPMFTAVLAPLAGRLTCLQLSCEGLCCRHLAVLCGLSQLQQLSLSFGLAADGPRPLLLDVLGALCGLTSLELQHTGLRLLAPSVVIANPSSLLHRLTSLRRLAFKSLPINKTLRSALPTLTNLTSLCLVAASGQLPIELPADLWRCSHLVALEVAPLSWADVVPLARLSALTSLCVRMERVSGREGQLFLQLVEGQAGDEGAAAGVDADVAAAGVVHDAGQAVAEQDQAADAQVAGVAATLAQQAVAHANLATAHAALAAAQELLAAAVAQQAAAHSVLQDAVLCILALLGRMRRVVLETDICLTPGHIARLGAGWCNLQELDLCCRGLGSAGDAGSGDGGGAAAAIWTAFPLLEHLRLRCHADAGCRGSEWGTSRPLHLSDLRLPAGLRSLEVDNLWGSCLAAAAGETALVPRLGLTRLVLRSLAPAEHALAVPQLQALLGCTSNISSSSNSSSSSSGSTSTSSCNSNTVSRSTSSSCSSSTINGSTSSSTSIGNGSTITHLEVEYAALSNAMCAAIGAACGPQLTHLRLTVSDLCSSTCSISGAGLAALLPRLTACQELCLTLPESVFDWRVWKALGCGKLRLRRLRLLAAPAPGSGGLSVDGGRRFCAALRKVASQLSRTLRQLAVGSCGGEVAAEELQGALGALVAALPTGCRVVVLRGSRGRRPVAWDH